MEDNNKTININTNADIALNAELLDEVASKLAEDLRKNSKKFYLSGGDSEDSAKQDKKAKIVEFFKVLNEGTGSAGGYLVPEEVSSQILSLMSDYSALRRLFTVIPMTSDTMRLNGIVTDPVVYKVGENANITPSDPVFGDFVLNAQKYAGVNLMTNELFDDTSSLYNLIDIVINSFARQIAKKEQEDFLNSTVSGSEGVFTVAGVTNVTMNTGDNSFDKVNWDYLTKMITALRGVSIMEADQAVFLMHPAIWEYVVTKKTTTNQYITPQNPQDREALSVRGLQVVLVNEAPSASAASTKFVALSYWKNHAFIGDRGDLTVTLSDSGTVGGVSAMERDLKILRVVKRTAFTTALRSGIVTLSTAA